jgi:hypothetical protein
MKLRHAAALALVGCYLMVPPAKVAQGDEVADTSAPLSEWSELSTYHTQADCEAACKTVRTEAERAQAIHFSNYPSSVAYAGVARRLAAARCIAANASRLKSK